MGRKKITNEEKKQNLSITVSSKNASRLDALGFTNKSKLIDWLLAEHFELTNKGGSYEK